MEQIIEYCPNLIYKGLYPGVLTNYHYSRLNHFQLTKYACKTNQLKIIEYLLENERTYIIDIKYLEISCEIGNIRVVKLMIEKGATNWNYGLIV
jgi:hypothetical protein